MTRKDYIAIAAALHAVCRELYADADRKAGHAHVLYVEAIADVMAADNSRFDRERFTAAAGVLEVVS